MGPTSFLNCVPFFWGLARTAALLNMDLVEDTPDALARRLLTGDLDVATSLLHQSERHFPKFPEVL